MGDDGRAHPPIDVMDLPAPVSRRLAGFIAAPLLLVLVILTLVIISRIGQPADSGASATGIYAVNPGGGTVSEAGTEATAITDVLEQAQTDQQSVTQAVTDAMACGNLTEDEQAFTTAQTDAQTLSQRALETPSGALDLPGNPQEPYEFLGDSTTVDMYYGYWVLDLENSCDPATTTEDEQYQAGATEDNVVTQEKTEFLGTWNSIAGKYGQPTFMASDI